MAAKATDIDVDLSGGSAKRGKDGRVTLVVSTSVLAALAAMVGSLGSNLVIGGGSDELLERRVREQLAADFDKRYVPIAVYEQRWALFEQRLDEQFRSVRVDLAALREQTKDLPRLAAQLELLQRGK